MRLALFGPPGAGKGTQAAKIAAAWRIPHISTGDMLRAEVRSGSELGRRVGEVIAAGRLVSDELIAEVVAARLRQPDAARGFLLDGFPRTRRQVDLLDELLAVLHHDLKGVRSGLNRVILLDVPDAVAEQRLLGRAVIGDAGQVRADDCLDVIHERLAVYKAETFPVAAIYEGRGLLSRVDGTGTIDQVFARITDLLGGPAAAGADTTRPGS